MAVSTLPRANTAIDSAALRQVMIDTQLRPSDVIEPRLLAAIASVARENFVPADRQAMAYADRAIPLAEGRALNAPLTTARLIADLAPSAGSAILLIGAATGYAAAVLAAMGVRVVAVEEQSELTTYAKAALADVELVTIVQGPLSAGAPAAAPCDALLIDGAVERIPAALLAQLNDGARIATGLADGAVTRLARAIRIAGVDAVSPLPFADLECVRLPGFAVARGFTF